MYWRRQWQPTPVFLPGESQGRGAWWAAVYGVTQSRTLLKRLSSSSSGHIPIQHWNWVWNISLRFFEYNPVQFLLKRIKRSIICNQLSRWYCVISKTVENSSDIYYRNKQPHIPKSQVLFTVTIFNNSLSCIWWPPPPPFFWATIQRMILNCSDLVKFRFKGTSIHFNSYNSEQCTDSLLLP